MVTNDVASAPQVGPFKATAFAMIFPLTVAIARDGAMFATGPIAVRGVESRPFPRRVSPRAFAADEAIPFRHGLKHGGPCVHADAGGAAGRANRMVVTVAPGHFVRAGFHGQI
jgi:hypothetical protein